MKQDTRHPEHDAVHAEIRGWFTNSLPAIGHLVSEQWFGYLTMPGDHVGARLILTVDSPSQVAPAIQEAKRECGNCEVTVWVDDRERAGLLDAPLRAAGAAAHESTVHLALVGDIARQPWPAGLSVSKIPSSGLEEWVVVKLKSFSDSESEPEAARLAKELDVRRGEASIAEYQLGSIDGEAVAVLAYYPDRDQLVFNLGTRMPYRHGGIAQAMLARWVDDARAAEARSMLINADELGRPAALYRRIGFVDEIYWYQKYTFSPAE